jgi:hypothetical protein
VSRAPATTSRFTSSGEQGPGSAASRRRPGRRAAGAVGGHRPLHTKTDASRSGSSHGSLPAGTAPFRPNEGSRRRTKVALLRNRAVPSPGMKPSAVPTPGRSGPKKCPVQLTPDVTVVPSWPRRDRVEPIRSPQSSFTVVELTPAGREEARARERRLDGIDLRPCLAVVRDDARVRRARCSPGSAQCRGADDLASNGTTATTKGVPATRSADVPRLDDLHATGSGGESTAGVTGHRADCALVSRLRPESAAHCSAARLTPRASAPGGRHPGGGWRVLGLDTALVSCPGYEPPVTRT